jgi:catechol 2,3-dioxygenase-like lactoylglutathione lyase family enzyme
MSDRADARMCRMGSLDHVHIRVTDRADAAARYAKHLGFEPVERFDFWATGFEGGPFQISADGCKTMLALFQASDRHPMIALTTGVALSVNAETFLSFTRSLPGEIRDLSGRPLVPNDVIDFDMCWAFNFVDPWSNRYELNCYDYDRIEAELIAPDAITQVRYWQRELYDEYARASESQSASRMRRTR